MLTTRFRLAATAVMNKTRSVRNFASLMERAQRQRVLSARREAHQLESKQEEQDDPVMAIFDEIDINGDGFLSREEFRIAIEKMRDLDITKMKRTLRRNDIAFNHKASVLGRRVIVNEAEFNAWQFIKNLPDYLYVADLCPPPALPPKKADAPEYTLVLDMDETLLHCDVDITNLDQLPDHTFPVKFQGKEFTVHAWLRPSLHSFLDKIRGKFEVVVFTASQPQYANAILDILDPNQQHFQHRLFRQSCIEVEDNHVKDLNVLGRDLSKVILVDNSPHVFGYQLDNGVPITSWYDDPNDHELEKLEWFLQGLEGDCRVPIREKFECYKLVDEAELYDERLAAVAV
jgi:CTD small phosphatase-like protein 2